MTRYRGYAPVTSDQELHALRRIENKVIDAVNAELPLLQDDKIPSYISFFSEVIALLMYADDAIMTPVQKKRYLRRMLPQVRDIIYTTFMSRVARDIDESHRL